MSIEEIRSLQKAAIDMYSQRNARFSQLRKLYEGDFSAWWDTGAYRADRVNVTFNYVRMLVKKAATFMAGDAPDFASIPQDGKKQALLASSRAEKILYKLLRISRFSRLLLQIAIDSALLGTGWAKVVLETDDNGKPVIPRVVYCKPEYVYPQSYQSVYAEKMHSVIYTYQLPLEIAKAEYGQDIGADSDLPGADTSNKEHSFDVATYTEYWSDDRYALVIGNTIVEDTKNPYGFIPFLPFPWFGRPGQLHGDGIIDDIIEINKLINTLASRRADSAILHCNPPLKYKNARLTSREEFLQDIDGGVHFLPGDADLQFLTWSGEPPTIAELQRFCLDFIFASSHIPEEAFHAAQPLTGMALRVGMDPLVKMIHEVRENWEPSLERMCEYLLRLAEKFLPDKPITEAVLEESKRKDPQKLDGKSIDGNYDFSVVWRDVLPRDDINMARFEVEKFRNGVQSLWTTMENLGIQQPDEEMERMKQEFEEPAIRPKERAIQEAGDAKALMALAKAGEMMVQRDNTLEVQNNPMQERFGVGPNPGTPQEFSGELTPAQEAQTEAYPGIGEIG